MRTRALLGLCVALLLLVAPARAEIIILPPDGTVVTVPTPLSNGTLWVRSGGGWIMLPPVVDGSQRILRQVYEGGHQVMRGRADWLTIDKSGRANVRLATVAAAEGQTWTIRIA